jgi:hypothetical protein
LQGNSQITAEARPLRDRDQIWDCCAFPYFYRVVRVYLGVFITDMKVIKFKTWIRKLAYYIRALFDENLAYLTAFKIDGGNHLWGEPS